MASKKKKQAASHQASSSSSNEPGPSREAHPLIAGSSEGQSSSSGGGGLDQWQSYSQRYLNAEAASIDDLASPRRYDIAYAENKRPGRSQPLPPAASHYPPTTTAPLPPHSPSKRSPRRAVHHQAPFGPGHVSGHSHLRNLSVSHSPHSMPQPSIMYRPRHPAPKDLYDVTQSGELFDSMDRLTRSQIAQQRQQRIDERIAKTAAAAQKDTPQANPPDLLAPSPPNITSPRGKGFDPPLIPTTPAIHRSVSDSIKGKDAESSSVLMPEAESQEQDSSQFRHNSLDSLHHRGDSTSSMRELTSAFSSLNVSPFKAVDVQAKGMEARERMEQFIFSRPGGRKAVETKLGQSKYASNSEPPSGQHRAVTVPSSAFPVLLPTPTVKIAAPETKVSIPTSVAAARAPTSPAQTSPIPPIAVSRTYLDMPVSPPLTKVPPPTPDRATASPRLTSAHAQPMQPQPNLSSFSSDELEAVFAGHGLEISKFTVKLADPQVSKSPSASSDLGQQDHNVKTAAFDIAQAADKLKGKTEQPIKKATVATQTARDAASRDSAIKYAQEGAAQQDQKETLEHRQFFSEWSRPETRDTAPAQVRRVLLLNLKSDTTPKEVFRHIWGGPIESLSLNGGIANVLFLDPAGAKKYLDATANRIPLSRDPTVTIFVEPAKETEVLAGNAKSWLEKKVTRCVKAVGIDEDFTSLQKLRMVAAGDSKVNRKFEHVGLRTNDEGVDIATFRFLTIKDALNFKNQLQGDEAWELCNIQFEADPCAAASSVHD